VKLWFIWTAILMIFILYSVFFGLFEPIAGNIFKWLSITIGPVLTLITGSTFFNHQRFSPVVTEKIYYNLALYASILYFSVTTISIFGYIGQCTDRAQVLKAIENSQIGLLIIQSVVITLLTYFFLKNKK
jgi:hypothetical protein